jgi:hypothetical protein
MHTTFPSIIIITTIIIIIIIVVIRIETSANLPSYGLKLKKIKKSMILVFLSGFFGVLHFFFSSSLLILSNAGQRSALISCENFLFYDHGAAPGS